MHSPRNLAFQSILDVIEKNMKVSVDQSEKLSPQDHALFLELKNGTFRDWLFLDFVLSQYLKKKPKKIPYAILMLSTYSLLFLTRMPAYAIFSEAKTLSRAKKLSIPEEKFIHGVLKTIEKNKAELLSQYEQTLNELHKGKLPTKDFEWAVLNSNQSFSQFFRFSENPQRSIETLLTFKRPWPLYGYEFSSLGVEGDLHEIQYHDTVVKNKFRVQGQSSYLASQWYADAICDLDKEEVTVLEMAAGKGGKLFSTIHLLMRSKRRPKKLKWIACDSEPKQLKMLEESAKTLFKDNFKWLELELVCADFDKKLPTQQKVDCIFLDAPCSGYGTLAKHPEIAVKAFLGENREKSIAPIQTKLLKSSRLYAHDLTMLIYSVCTLTKSETADRIHANFETSPILEYLEIWPNDKKHSNFEGFYISKLKMTLR